MIEARVEGLDPAQTIDGSAVQACPERAVALPYDNLVLLDAAGTTRLAEEAGITAEPLLLNFGQANEEETPESTLPLRRIRTTTWWRAAGVPCGGIQESPGRRVEPPTRPGERAPAGTLMRRRRTARPPWSRQRPVRVVVSRRYPAPYEIAVDIGRGAYRRHGI